MKKSYERYQLVDFLTDEAFKQWVIYHEHQDYWLTVQMQYPEKKALIQEAKELLLTLSVPAQHAHPHSKQLTWESIQDHIAAPAFSETPLPRLARRKTPWAFIAAAITLALLTGIFFTLYRTELPSEQLVYQSLPNQRKQLILPDSSRIILSGKATLRVSANWTSANKREVWLDGNAYFEVTHHAQRPFIVHTFFNSQIEVLGTQFNISNLNQQVLIHLAQGAIQVKQGLQSILLKPGEGLLLSEKRMQPQLSPHLIPLWDTQELLMQGASLQEVLTLSQEIFGDSVAIVPSLDLKQQLEGIIPLENHDQVIQALSDLLGKDITFHKK